jgi:hypothetical protein
MSAGKNTHAAIVSSFNLIGPLIRLFEALIGKGNGAAKKAAVIEGFSALASDGVAAVAANNPTYQADLGALIDSAVAVKNAEGTMPAPMTLAPVTP